MVRCPSCGLVFQDPQPSEERLAETYYHDAAFADALFGELRRITLDNAEHKRTLLEDAGVLKPGMRVLDVGSSSGAWLEVAAAAGMRAVGVEIGEETSARARDRGLDVRTGTLEQALPELAGEGFDLITFWDVLEHLRDPRHELELAHRLLAPDGLVAATFPNVEGLYPQLTYRLIARRTGVWEYPELPVHLYDFSPASASRLFAGQGFDVEAVRTFAIPYGFYRSTSLSPERTGSGPKAFALRSAFFALRSIAYPAARLLGRGNAQFILARRRGDPARPVPS
jgi:SAM-dependent methyltransferase